MTHADYDKGMWKVNNAPIDEAAYGKLLRKALPRPIRTEKDNERYLQVVERLMDLGERLTPEQHELMGTAGDVDRAFRGQSAIR